MNWTDARTAILTEMWCAGKTAREIAQVLCVSRNAVIGKANREGLAVAREVKPEIKKRSLRSGTFKTCQWPYGEGPYTFCGKPVVKGSYCAEHDRRAHRVAVPKDDDEPGETGRSYHIQSTSLRAGIVD